MPAVKLTDPVNAFIGVTARVELPTKVASVVMPGPAMEKSTTWKMAGGVEVNVIVGVPPVPVTVAGYSPPMAALQVRLDWAVPPETRLTGVTALQTRPEEGFGAKDTDPAKPFTEATVTVDVAELVARIVEGKVALVVMVKYGEATVPYTPLFSGTPVMLNPFASKIELRPLFDVTVSTLNAATPGNATLEPGPFTAV
jgi:hypothetical protein